MLKDLLTNTKHSLISVLPVTLIVLLISATPLVNFTSKEILVFSISTIFLILGIGLFNLGAEYAMTPMGEQVGVGLTKSRKLNVLLVISFIIGVLITVAEPDLKVLSEQLGDNISDLVLMLSVGIGVGFFLLLAIIRIVFKKDLTIMLMFLYMTVFAISAILFEKNKGHFLPLAFDSGGVTTGPITVPFIMAFGVGIAASVGGRNMKENSFGIIALCSVGPIIAITILFLFAKEGMEYSLPDYAITNEFLKLILGTMLEVAIALGCIVVFFLIVQFVILKLSKSVLLHLLIGVAFTYFGLVLFLASVKIGYMPIGFKLGQQLASGNRAFAIIFAFIVGAVVVLAEPAVHILNKQIEDATDGMVTKKAMLTALSIGVGLSIAVSVMRVIFNFSLLYLLIPGYLISLLLSFFVPKIYSAIAFDSGGVASGPLTSSFILPFVIGMCESYCGEDQILNYAFGVVAMVAMIPLITIQILGFRAIAAEKVRENIIMKRILDADDEQIINFE